MSNSTAGSRNGTAAAASRIFRTRSSASGRPLQAIAPRSQITTRRVFWFIVPMKQRRPRRCCVRTSAQNSAVTSRSINAFIGAELLSDCVVNSDRTGWVLMRSFVVEVVKTLVSSQSHLGPLKTIDATNAPLLIPVTTSNSGRWPVAVQPTSSPAPYAPYWPPPETARICSGRGGLLGTGGVLAGGAASAAASVSYVCWSRLG